MTKRLYVSVCETKNGVVGHLIGPKQYSKMVTKERLGIVLYAGVELYIVADKSIDSKEAVNCAKFVGYEWQEAGRPTLVEVREKVRPLARKKVMR